MCIYNIVVGIYYNNLYIYIREEVRARVSVAVIVEQHTTNDGPVKRVRETIF